MSDYSMLPAEVIETDHRLEKAASTADEGLAKHRWHWTLDESNPNRVSLREYARHVGRDVSRIAHQAKGYANWVLTPGSTLWESIERAKMSTERAEIVEAVAAANEITFGHAAKQYTPDVTRVREATERAAERQPDMTTEDRREYAKRTAQNLARSRASEQQRRDDRKRQRTANFMLLDARLDQMRRAGIDALNIARDAEVGPEEIALLETTLDSLRALISLLNSAITGASDVDWDSELANLSKEA